MEIAAATATAKTPSLWPSSLESICGFRISSSHINTTTTFRFQQPHHRLLLSCSQGARASQPIKKKTRTTRSSPKPKPKPKTLGLDTPTKKVDYQPRKTNQVDQFPFSDDDCRHQNSNLIPIQMRILLAAGTLGRKW
jgi:hypothetical protein